MFSEADVIYDSLSFAEGCRSIQLLAQGNPEMDAESWTAKRGSGVISRDYLSFYSIIS